MITGAASNVGTDWIAARFPGVDPAGVEIEVEGQAVHVPNDAVIVCAGGILPTAFLRDIGIEVETKHGTA